MITDHAFRTYNDGATNANTGTRGGITHGMCPYNGTCNQPREAHQRAVRGRTKLTPEQQDDAAHAYDQGEPVADIAARYDVSPDTILNTLRRRTAGAR